MHINVIRLPETKKRTGLSRSSIYLKISKNEFPKQILISKRAVGWIESEVNEWIEHQIQSSRNNRKAY